MEFNSLILILKLLFKAFALTTLIEIIVSYIMSIRYIKNILTIVFVNFITNISANVITIYLNPSNSQIIIMEIVIIAIEGFLFKNLFLYEDKFLLNKISNNGIRYVLFSLIINLSSFLFGIILF